MNNKTLVGVLAVGGLGLLGFWWYKKHQGAMPVVVSSGGSGSSPMLGGGGYSADLIAVMNREGPDIALKLRNLVSELSPDQVDMLNSIAHSWNNGIALTPDQAEFWSAVGVF